MSETIPDLIPEAAWRLLIAEPSVDDYLRAAGITIAAELERHADDLARQAEVFGAPPMDTPASGMVSVLIDVAAGLRLRAAELRGEATS